MVEKSLNDFLERVAPYQKLWGSLRASGAAVNVDGTWFNLVIRVELVEEPPSKTEIQSLEPHFLYYVAHFPMSVAENVIRQIVLGGRFELKRDVENSGAFAEILMKRGPDKADGTPSAPVHWGMPLFHEVGTLGVKPDLRRTSITLGGLGQSLTDILSTDAARRIEVRLRSASPCYDGLTGLFAHILPGVRYTGRDYTLMEVVAELPFELRKGERDLAIVEGAAQTPEGALSLRCFYGPSTGFQPSITVLRPSDAEKLTDNRLRWTLTPAWPERSDSARAFLFFEDEQVQTLEVNRWPSAGNLRQIVDAYFDPSQEKLKESLLELGALNQQSFEWSVARLLHLVGLPATWYGKGAAEAKPDLAGYVEGGPVLLAECTLQNPSQKFSSLRERSKQLQAEIGLGTDVLALVFTRAEVVASEKQQAHDHGLVVVGFWEIQELLKMIESGAGKNEALAYLQGLRSNLMVELETILDRTWPPPW